MAFSEFTLESAESLLGIVTREADLFPGNPSSPVPAWLPGLLARGTRLALLSEKARSEFIVVPILLAARELCEDRFAIFSGQRLDVDPDKGLTGECDFILALGPAVPPLHAPIATVVEAKKNDIEAGLGQCIAQMVAARQFNDAAGRTDAPIYGCVTTGETWQFLRLAGRAALLDRRRYYLDNIAGILGALGAIAAEALPPLAASEKVKAMKVWFTADTHLGHGNIIKYCNRPFLTAEEQERVGRDPRGKFRLCDDTIRRHDAALLDAINERAAEEDVLWILGDFCWGGFGEAKRYRERIRCRDIRLVWGNHDHRSIRPLFTESIEQGMIRVEGQDIWLNHYPMRSWDRAFHGSWQLYGHVHGRLAAEDVANVSSLTKDMGVDACEYRPWSFEELAAYMVPRIVKFRERKAAFLEGRDEGMAL